MERKAVSGIMLAVLLSSVVTLTFSIQPVSSEPKTIIVPDDYPTIQTAVAAANSGDMIYVRAGTYFEEVLIYGKSISLIGDNAATTIIDASFTGIPIEVKSSNRVYISGFTAINSGHDMRGNMISESWPESGILLWNSDECIIRGNVVVDNFVGVTIYSSWQESKYNTIRGNLITNNSWIGIHLRGHFETGLVYSENILIENTIETNWWGLASYLHAHNCIYHNNFLNNELQVSVTEGDTHIWNNGYPSGGNYWSDYTGIDEKRGSYQNETGSDGIGDTPHIIDGSNRDEYPFMGTWTSILGDVNGDGKVDNSDLFGLSWAYGSTPLVSDWNPFCDFNEDNIVDALDLYRLGRNYGKTSP